MDRRVAGRRRRRQLWGWWRRASLRARVGFAAFVPLAALATVYGIPERFPAGESRILVEVAAPAPFDLDDHDLAAGEADLDLGPVDVPSPFRIQRGETVGALLARYGLEPGEAHAAVEALREHVDLRRVRAGWRGEAFLDSASTLQAFELQLPDKGKVAVRREEGGWRSEVQPFVETTAVRRVEGTIEDNLESSIRSAGGDPRVAYRMANVLQWDLDFNRDLRTGDRFRVVFEDRYLDGERVGPGRILAMSYESALGELPYEAYLWGEDGGYYDGEGRPLRKMFLRSPLEFSRVTSRFTNRRFHPILKTYRPHYGVDYGAPTGTPVRVTASGVVAEVKRTRGAGKMVKVRHPNGYLSAYLHLSRYADGMSPGRRVRQGEVVGYVGATGYATAPHLDYRVQKDGKWIDPLGIKSVPAEPIPEARRDDYRAALDHYRLALSGESLDLPDSILGPPEEDRPAASRLATAAPSSPSRDSRSRVAAR